MEAILLVIHVIIAMALIGIVLIQRSDQDGFGLGSGSGSNFMTGRQSANLLTRSTSILAALFMVNSLALTIMAANRSDVSIVDRIEAAQESKPVAPTAQELDSAAETDAIPDAPVADDLIPSTPVAE